MDSHNLFIDCVKIVKQTSLKMMKKKVNTNLESPNQVDDEGEQIVTELATSNHYIMLMRTKHDFVLNFHLRGAFVS